MTNKMWLDLIEEKEEEIIEISMKAYQEAMDNKHLRFIVELDEDGEVTYWYDVAGGNTFHASVFNGEAIEILEVCFQYFDEEEPDWDMCKDEIIGKLQYIKKELADDDLW